MSITKELIWTHVKETYNGDPTAATQYQLATFKILKLLRQACLAVNAMPGAPNTDNGILLCTDGTASVPAQNRLVFTGDDATDCLKMVSAGAGTNHTWATWKFFGRYWCFDYLANGVTYNYFTNLISDCALNADGTSSNRPTQKTTRAFYMQSGYGCSLTTNTGYLYWSNKAAANLRFQYHLMYCSTAIRLFVNIGGATCFAFMAERPVSTRVQPTYIFCRGGSQAAAPTSYVSFYDNNCQVTSAAATGLAIAPVGGTWDLYCKLQPDCAMATSDWYIGCQIEIVGGLRDGEIRTVDGYNVATNEIHVSVAFSGVLDATSYYSITKSAQAVHLFAPGVGNLWSRDMRSYSNTTVTDLEQKWLVSPLTVWSSATYNTIINDRVPDLYAGSASMVHGQLYEVASPADWVQYGNLIVPNDSTACPVT